MLRDCESYALSTNGADYVAAGRWLNIGTPMIISAGAGLDLDPVAGFAYGSGIGYTRRSIGGAPFTTLTFGARLFIPVGQILYYSFYDLVNLLPQLTVELNGSNGVLTILRGGAAGTVLFTSNAGQFPPSARFYFEMQGTIGAGTSGACIVRINQSTVINLSGVNTQATTRAYCDTTQASANVYGGAYEQHCYWADTTGTYNTSFLGDRRVFGALPTANGDTTQLTPVGSSSNFDNVNNSPPLGDSGYNYSGTVGNYDLYKGTAPANVTAVAGVMISSITRKDDSGTRNWNNIIKSGGTIAHGATLAMAGSYTNLNSDVFETSPATGAPFTAAAIAAGTLQWGGQVE